MQDTALRKIDEIVNEALEGQKLAGMAVGVISNGALVYTRGFGYADRERERPVTTNTVFRIGSISKTFTAIGLMQLWEQGKFQLDDPINHYLKAYQVIQRDLSASPITFRHLLTHTSGLGELRSLNDALMPVIGLGTKPSIGVPALSAYYQAGLVAEIHPGTKWSYANHGFATLGQLVEDISGEPFDEYMRSHVFAPLGMHHTDYILTDRVRDELASGYTEAFGKLKPAEYLDIVVTGAGSIFSSVADMAKYVQALLNGGRNEHGSVLKPETLQMMMTPQYRVDEHLPAMGLAFIVEELEGHRMAGHDGGWPGFISMMMTAPDDKTGILIFTNTYNSAATKALMAVSRKMLQHLLDIPDQVEKVQTSVIPYDRAVFPELCGFYGPDPGWNTNLRIWLGFGSEFEVYQKDGVLMLRSLVGLLWRGVRLYPTGDAQNLVYKFISQNQVQTVVFRRNPSGIVDAFHIGLNTMYKRSFAQSLKAKVVAGAGVAVSLLAGIAGWQIARRYRMKD